MKRYGRFTNLGGAAILDVRDLESLGSSRHVTNQSEDRVGHGLRPLTQEQKNVFKLQRHLFEIPSYEC
jgi:hypothetical protein